MAVGTYKLPICDGCKLPWLPVGWTQDSDPRAHTGKPLRCGKCKSIGWDREFVKEMRKPLETVEISVQVPIDLVIPNPREQILIENLPEPVSPTLHARCRHRMTNCPLCKPPEAA